MSFDDFNELVKDQNKKDLRNDLDYFVDYLGDHVNPGLKTSIINVIIGFAACNETISNEEFNYIEQLIN